METKREIKIELPQEAGQGVYSNLAIVVHSASEFVIDFTRIMPGMNKAKVYSRIILAPIHAKALAKTLEENIKKYETKFGEIKLEKKEEHKIGFIRNETK
jgi:hypothetical protein